MITAPCNDCRKGVCQARCEMLAKSAFAWANDRPAPICDDQVLTWQARLAA